MRVVAVTGGRNYQNRALVFETLSNLSERCAIDVLVHGGCRGSDALCAEWAGLSRVQVAEFAITQVQWAADGRKCGPRRNALMLEVTHPNLLVAFPGGRGTASCVNIAKKLGIEVLNLAEVLNTCR